MPTPPSYQPARHSETKRPEAQNNPRHAVCSAKLYERRRLLLGASGCLDNGGGGGSVLTQIVTHLAKSLRRRAGGPAPQR